VAVDDVRGHKIRLSFEAPEGVEIWREEIWLEIQKAKNAKEG